MGAAARLLLGLADRLADGFAVAAENAELGLSEVGSLSNGDLTLLEEGLNSGTLGKGSGGHTENEHSKSLLGVNGLHLQQQYCEDLFSFLPCDPLGSRTLNY